MQRLQTRAQFQAVLAGGIVAKTTHFALHCIALTQAPQAITSSPSGSDISSVGNPGKAGLFPKQDCWLGAMAPKRCAKKAVTRNAIKRQIYALGEAFSPNLQPAAFVVRLRSSFSRNDFVSAASEPLKRAVRAELLTLLRAGGLIL